MGPGLRRDLILGSITEHGEHRIADVFDIFGKHAGLDRGKAGVLEIALDEGGVAPVVEGAPDCDRLGPEAAVRKADEIGAPGRSTRQTSRNTATGCCRYWIETQIIAASKPASASGSFGCLLRSC